MRQQLALAEAEVPADDRAAWAAAFAAGDIFDGGGAGVHLSPGSRRSLWMAYRRWLGFLSRAAPNTLALPLAERVTPERVAAYLAEGQARSLGPTALWNDCKQLYDTLRLLAPEADWSWLLARKRRLERNVTSRRLTHAVTTLQLAELGLRLMAEVAQDGPRSTDYLCRYRDGLLLALLVHRPLRRRTLAGLRIGRQLQRQGETWLLVLGPDDLKTRGEATYAWPAPLVTHLEHYLSIIRPQFPGAADHEGVWASSKGRPMGAEALYEAVRKRTAAAFGQAINLHQVRTIAATTLATDAPEALGLAAGLLAQRDLRMLERHYNQARSLTAGRRQAALLDQLRCDLRHHRRP